MDPGILATRTRVKRIFIAVYLLLGSTCCSGTADSGCSCSSIPWHYRTKTPASNCSIIKNTFRYTCIDQYVRKAGTSNLIRCTSNGNPKWTNATLICIEDPLNPPKITTTSSTSTTSAVTPSVYVISTLSSETDLETASSALPPPHTPGTTLQTTTQPQPPSSTNAPSTAQASSTTSLTLPSTSTVSSSTTTRDAPSTAQASSTTSLTLPSTSTVSSSTTTRGARRLNRTTSPSSSLPISPSSSTSSPLSGPSVATSVIVPCVLILLVMAAGGAVCWFYKRKTRKRTQRNHINGQIAEEENIPMRQNNRDT